MNAISRDDPGFTTLLMGNEAIARGVLEAGAKVACAYPGTPSSEIIDRLAKAADEFNMYVEWSVNEKVAMEIASAASFAGVRAVAAMKQNGVNVVLDFLSNAAYTGVNAGLVLVVGDDPGALSSSNEQDSRQVAKILDLPLLEPATFQEAKDMTKWAFEVSEAVSNVCIVRGVTRIMHARGNVTLGELPDLHPKAKYDTSKVYAPPPGAASKSHALLHENLKKLRDLYETSPFNWYVGPENPELLIVACGSGWVYSREAVKLLSAEKAVGILKLGATWPLPEKLVSKHLLRVAKVLVVEEVDAFLEGNLKELAATLAPGRTWTFFGKESGHISPCGENNVDIALNAIASVLGLDRPAREPEFERACNEIASRFVLTRELQFCAGCPHRATYWAIKQALLLDGRDGVVTGDIGCYSMGQMPTGFMQMKTSHGMGSGVGVASGLGKLKQFDFTQPVLSVCGDSTFFHAAVPALLNSVHNGSDYVVLLLDNAGTAMTGFQPHPGMGRDAMGRPTAAVSVESVCNAFNIPVAVADPYDVEGARAAILDVLKKGAGPRMLIFRRECALIRASKKDPLFKVRVNPERCLGDACGCNRYCTRVFKCPGLMWDRGAKKAAIDQAICSGCGVCACVCPQSAIEREAYESGR